MARIKSLRARQSRALHQCIAAEQHQCRRPSSPSSDTAQHLRSRYNCLSDIQLILLPFYRIISNVCDNILIFLLLANHTFIIIVLPQYGTVCSTKLIDTSCNNRLKGAYDRRQRTNCRLTELLSHSAGMFLIGTWLLRIQKQYPMKVIWHHNPFVYQDI